MKSTLLNMATTWNEKELQFINITNRQLEKIQWTDLLLKNSTFKFQKKMALKLSDFQEQTIILIDITIPIWENWIITNVFFAGKYDN